MSFNVLITGGTGSFGKQIVQKFLADKKIKKIVIFSRDEFKQYEMNNYLSHNRDHKKLRFFLGDIRDKDRLFYAFKDIDIVVHAAALKQVPAAEYNPFEFIKTNVIGAQNIVEAALNTSVKKIIALSTDKAVSPINLYGASKLCSDKIFLAGNNIKGKKDLRISLVRYGNVMSSRGSVIPLFLEQKKRGVLTLTHKEMTRFNINLKECVDMVYWLIKNSYGGEILIPKIKSFRLIDIAKAICPKCKIKYIGVRDGEKIHEELISKYDSMHCYDIGKYYLLSNLKNYMRKYKKKSVSSFSYNSKDNKPYLSIFELKKLIQNQS